MSRTADGTILEVSTVGPIEYTQAAYEAISPLTIVGEVVDIGQFGVTYADVTTYSLNSRNVGHIKGSRDTGETPITVDNDRTDAGQIILREHQDGAKVDEPVMCKITHQNGDVDYYMALVYSFASQSLAQDTVYRAAVSMRVVADTQVFVAAPQEATSLSFSGDEISFKDTILTFGVA